MAGGVGVSMQAQAHAVMMAEVASRMSSARGGGAVGTEDGAAAGVGGAGNDGDDGTDATMLSVASIATSAAPSTIGDATAPAPSRGRVRARTERAATERAATEPDDGDDGDEVASGRSPGPARKMVRSRTARPLFCVVRGRHP